MQLSREERIEVLMDKLMEIWEEFEMLDDEPIAADLPVKVDCPVS